MNPNPKDELLPCPFCGVTPWDFESGEVYCSNKHCKVRPKAWDAEQWNARHSPTPPLPDLTKGGEDKQVSPFHTAPAFNEHGSQSRPEQQQLSRGDIKAILIKCFEHLGNEIKDKTLNESSKDGTQALSWEVAKILDSL